MRNSRLSSTSAEMRNIRDVFRRTGGELPHKGEFRFKDLTRDLRNRFNGDDEGECIGACAVEHWCKVLPVLGKTC